ncbi:uncharacterized protein LOC144436382 [Glandiceps talaboti]
MKYFTGGLVLIFTMTCVQSQDLFADDVVITSPIGNYSVDVPTDIIFNMAVGNRDRENEGNITGIKVYLTNRDQYEKATIISDPIVAVVDAGSAAVTVPAATESFKIAANGASIWVDKNLCSGFTNICFVIQHSETDTQTEESSDDDDTCLLLDGIQASIIESCPVVDDNKPDSATTLGPYMLLLSLALLSVVGKFLQ